VREYPPSAALTALTGELRELARVEFVCADVAAPVPTEKSVPIAAIDVADDGLIADLVHVVTSRDGEGALVLADLLPNPARWDHRPLRWRAPHGLATASVADRLVILGAVSTILQNP
jgi:hypothetical protein